MTSLEPDAVKALDGTELAAMLRAWAERSYPCEAAVELLVAHGMWLRRSDFRAAAVDAIDEGWTRDGTAPMASVDWTAAALFASKAPCSSSERSVLLAACSLGGHDAGALTVLTRSLDRANLTLLLQAVAHAAGWHEHGITAHVTGHVPPLGGDDAAEADDADEAAAVRW